MDRFDDELDTRIEAILTGQAPRDNASAADSAGAYENLAQEIARVMLEESPRPSSAARARGLAQLRARAAQKRASRRFNALLLWLNLPRWIQVAAVALVVVVIANGLNNASASSLPGSPLYMLKRVSEQGQVLIAPTAGERARVWMNLASRRLDEVQKLVATEHRVDAGALSAIDDSISSAMMEIQGTRGAERVALLQALTQLAVRQQSIIDALVTQSLPQDRAQLEQISHFLAGVATTASTGDSEPLLIPTATPTATPTESATSARDASSATATEAATAPATLIPTSTASLIPPSSTLLLKTATPVPPTFTPLPVRPTATPVPPTSTTQVEEEHTATPQATLAPVPQKTDTPESQKTDTPEPQKTDTSEPQKTNTPEVQKTDTSEPHQTNTAEPTKTPGEDH